MNERFFLTCVFAIAFFVSCERSSDTNLSLPTNPLLSSSSSWALVKESYVRLKEGPAEGTRDLGNLRDAVLVEVLGREFGKGSVLKERGLWCRIRVETEIADATAKLPEPSEGKKDDSEPRLEGWVPASSLVIYDSREQALGAMRAFR